MTTARAESLPPAALAPAASAEERACRRYVALFLAVFCTLLAAVLALNLLLGERAVSSPAVIKAASEWQQSTRGTTYPPPITHNRPFKILRLHDRLPDINAVVFGASTVMGITA